MRFSSSIEERKEPSTNLFCVATTAEEWDAIGMLASFGNDSTRGASRTSVSGRRSTSVDGVMAVSSTLIGASGMPVGGSPSKRKQACYSGIHATGGGFCVTWLRIRPICVKLRTGRLFEIHNQEVNDDRGGQAKRGNKALAIGLLFVFQ